MAKNGPLDQSMIARVLGSSEVRFAGYTAEEQAGGSWAVWGQNPDVPMCRVAAGEGFHSRDEAREIAVRIAQALNLLDQATR